MEKYKLINERTRRGIWIDEFEFVRILNILKIKNKGLFNKLNDGYKYLNEEDQENEE